MVIRSVSVCTLYAVTSVATSFTFKTIFSSFKFEATFTLLACQCVLTLAFCEFLKRRCKGIPGLEVPELDRSLIKAALPAGVLFVCNVAAGWAGIKLVNIPMFFTVRRTTTVFTLAAEYILLGNVASVTVQGGIALTVVGALVAGYDTLISGWQGYGFVLLNNAFTAASWSATKKFSDTYKVKGFGLTLYNAVAALPFCVVLAVLNGEVGYILNYPHLTEPGFFAALITASSLGVGMNYVVFLANVVTSPLATSVTGNLKDVGATILGAWLFGDFVPTVSRVVGILISFVGAAIFS